MWKELENTKNLLEIKIMTRKAGYNVTTSSWTLPANVAISLNPDFEYVELSKQKKLNLGKILAEQAFSAMEIQKL